jgi:hypothetical protein
MLAKQCNIKNHTVAPGEINYVCHFTHQPSSWRFFMIAPDTYTMVFEVKQGNLSAFKAGWSPHDPMGFVSN